MTLPYRGPRIPPRGPSGASRPPAQPTFTLDVMEFIDESKRIERHKNIYAAVRSNSEEFYREVIGEV